MSNATVSIPVPQADFHSAASTAIPWFSASAPEQQAQLWQLYSDLNADSPLSVAEYAADAVRYASAAEYLGSLTSGTDTDEPVPQKAADVWTKYAAAVDKYARSESERQLDVGKWAHAYILAYVGSETDAAVRRSRRSAAVTRCQDYITDTCTSGVPVTVDRALRLYAVAQVFGVKEARQLGIGKLRAFEGATYRDKETEAWGFKDNVTEAQQTALRDLWAKAVAGTVTCTAGELEAEVKKAMGKEAKTPSQSTEKPQETKEAKQEGKSPCRDRCSASYGEYDGFGARS